MYYNCRAMKHGDVPRLRQINIERNGSPTSLVLVDDVLEEGSDHSARRHRGPSTPLSDEAAAEMGSHIQKVIDHILRVAGIPTKDELARGEVGVSGDHIMVWQAGERGKSVLEAPSPTRPAHPEREIVLAEVDALKKVIAMHIGLVLEESDDRLKKGLDLGSIMIHSRVGESKVPVRLQIPLHLLEDPNDSQE